MMIKSVVASMETSSGSPSTLRYSTGTVPPPQPWRQLSANDVRILAGAAILALRCVFSEDIVLAGQVPHRYPRLLIPHAIGLRADSSARWRRCFARRSCIFDQVDVWTANSKGLIRFRELNEREGNGGARRADAHLGSSNAFWRGSSRIRGECARAAGKAKLANT
jgi:hypothetical protein